MAMKEVYVGMASTLERLRKNVQEDSFRLGGQTFFANELLHLLTCAQEAATKVAQTFNGSYYVE